MSRAPRPGAVPNPPNGRGDRLDIVIPSLVLAGGAIALALLLLLPLAVEHATAPPGWDSAFYAGRIRLVLGSGLSDIGLVRAVSPSVMAMLGGVTFADQMTTVVVAPVVFAAMLVFGLAAFARQAFDVSPLGAVVVGVAATFGLALVDTLGHVDNVLCLAFTTAAYATACAHVRSGRGAAATGVLLSAAALAEWPVALTSMAVLAVALVPFLLGRPGGIAILSTQEASRRARRVGTAIGAAVLVTGLSLLVRAPSGWLGLALTGHIRHRLLSQFESTLASPRFLVTIAAGALGVMVLVRRLRRRPDAASWFAVALFAGWVLLGLGAAVGQLVGLPTAASRVLATPVPVALFGGLLVWWLIGGERSREPAGASRLPAVAVAVVVLIAASVVVWREADVRARQAYWPGAAEIASASDYAAEAAPGRPIVFAVHLPGGIGEGHAWHQVEALMDPSVLSRTVPYFGDPRGILSGRPSRSPLDLSVPTPPDPAAILRKHPVILLTQAQDPKEFAQLRGTNDAVRVGFGVLALEGRGLHVPRPVPGTTRGVAPAVDSGAAMLVVRLTLALGVLLLVGLGWSLVLCGADGFTAVALAPPIGAAVAAVVALVWLLVGLPSSVVWLALLLAGGMGFVIALGRSPGRRAGGPRTGHGDGTARAARRTGPPEPATERLRPHPSR